MLVVNYITGRLQIKIQAQASHRFNEKILNHFNNISTLYFTNKNVSFLTQQTTFDIDTLVGFCMSIISGILLRVISLIALSIVVYIIDPRLTLVFAIVLLLYSIVFLAFRPIVYRTTLEATNASNNYYAGIHERVSKVGFIKAHSINEVYSNKMNKVFGFMFKKIRKSQDVSYLFGSIDTIITTVAQVAIFIIGGIAVVRGSMTIGFFTVLISYFTMLLNSLKYFFGLGKNYQETLVSYERISEILSEAEHLNGATEIDAIRSITIRDLNFSYNEDQKILKDFNFTFKAGNIYCLTGENGAGKSTFINILLGLYVHEVRGEILFNDVELRDIDMVRLRKHNIGYTEQNPVLINGTILDNLLLDSVDDNRDFNHKKLNALTLFSFKRFVDTLPEGLDTVIGEDYSNISGGERQKLSILRQIVKNPDLMIFDEPTSSLDNESKAAFIEHLVKIKEDKIIVIVTHDNYVKGYCDFEVIF